MHEIDSARIDVGYALTQLRRWRDIPRAIDALERVEEVLTRLRERPALEDTTVQEDEDEWAAAEREWSGLRLAEQAFGDDEERRAYEAAHDNHGNGARIYR